MKKGRKEKSSDTLDNFSDLNQCEINDSSCIKEIVTICGHKYFIDNILSETDLFTLYKVSDDLHREFCYKRTKYISRSEYVNALILLQNKPGIAKIFEYESTGESVNVILELGSPIDPFMIPKNLIKRRMRQILTAVSSISQAQLHFSNLQLSDFVETNGGIRLMHVESTINQTTVSEHTFAPITHILKALIEQRRITMDPTMFRDLNRMIQKAGETEVAQINNMLRTELFKDDLKVTINKSSTNRSSTPDPHNLRRIQRNPIQISNSKDLSFQAPTYDSPQFSEIEIIPKIPASRASSSISKKHILYYASGVALCTSVLITLQIAIGLSMTLTALALKPGLIAVACCAALTVATFTSFDDDYDIAESVAKLKKWSISLGAYTLFLLFSKYLEVSADQFTAPTACVIVAWMIGALVL